MKAIEQGEAFDTYHETGLVALTDANERGEFTALDSDAVLCTYSFRQVVRVY